MLSINTNLSSLIAQRSIKMSTLLLNQAIERMSTGFKVNHAKDNAAAYSIITDMDTKIGAYQVAEDNVAMGLDMLSTANGSLDQISDKLSRLRALAEQSANGTYDTQSKSAINAEANALVDEIERLYSTAEYNGKKLLKADSTFLQEVTKVDTTGMTPMAEVDESQTLAQGEYTIGSDEDLAKLARMQNAGKITAGSTFVQTANIDLSDYTTGEGWTPIGGNNGYTNPFKSTYDGNGYTISNLYINRDKACQGLFGYSQGATYKNIGVISGSVTGKAHGGGLLAANENGGSIINCFSNVDVKSTAGGSGSLVGIFNGDNCQINYCYATGNVNTDNLGAGLIASFGTGSVLNSYATGNVSGYKASGLISEFTGGANPTTIENCYATGDVTGADGVSGFAMGIYQSEMTFKNCYSTGNLTVIDSTDEVWCGGFSAGPCEATVTYTNCYSTGDFNIYNDNCIIGDFIMAYDSNVTIENCYTLSKASFASMTATTNYDGFVTLRGGTTANITDSKVIESGSVPFTLEFNYANTPLKLGLQVGIDEDENSSRINLEVSHKNLDFDYFRNLGLKAGNYLEKIDDYISVVLEKSVEFGATQNRLESALDEISIQYENLVSSRSTLRDSDIAEVSAQYIQQQILQQAAATLLSTANQSPSIALQLI